MRSLGECIADLVCHSPATVIQGEAIDNNNVSSTFYSDNLSYSYSSSSIESSSSQSSEDVGGYSVEPYCFEAESSN